MTKWLDKLKHQYQLFADKTSIQGINELYYAKSAPSQILWLVLVIGTNVLTGYQIYKALVEYQNQGTVTQSQQLASGRLYYPPIKLCYNFWPYWVDPEKVEHLDLSKDGLLYAMSYLSFIYIPNNYNFSAARMDLKEVMLANKFKTMSELYNFIRKLTPPGSRGSAISFNSTSFNSANELCYIANVSQILNTKQKLDNKKNDDENVPEDKKSLSMFLDHNLLYSPRMNLSGKEYNSYIYKTMTKMAVKSDQLTLTQGRDKKFNRETFFNQPDIKSTKFYIMPSLYIDGEDPIRLNPDVYHNDISLIVNVHKWKNSQTNKCIEGQQRVNGDDAECYDKCSSKFYGTPPCSCFKFFHSRLQKNDTLENLCSYCMYKMKDVNDSACYLKPRIYAESLLNCSTEVKSYQLSNCTSKCRNATKGCEVWNVQTTMTTSSFTEFEKRFFTTSLSLIEIAYPTESTIFVVSDEDAVTWEDFIGNVGGLLGIWMGASILSYVQFVYLCCCADCNCFPRHQSKLAKNLNDQRRIRKRQVDQITSVKKIDVLSLA